MIEENHMDNDKYLKMPSNNNYVRAAPEVPIDKLIPEEEEEMDKDQAKDMRKFFGVM